MARAILGATSGFKNRQNSRESGGSHFRSYLDGLLGVPLSHRDKHLYDALACLGLRGYGVGAGTGSGLGCGRQPTHAPFPRNARLCANAGPAASAVRGRLRIAPAERFAPTRISDKGALEQVAVSAYTVGTSEARLRKAGVGQARLKPPHGRRSKHMGWLTGCSNRHETTRACSRRSCSRAAQTSWSARPTIDPGDLARLYEIGDPTDPLDAEGRGHIEWVLRARSTAVPDNKWPYVAEFEMAPLVPLPLHIAKRSRRFAEGPGANMQGSYNELEPALWTDLVKLIDVQNPGFETRMSTPGGRDTVFEEVLRPDDSVEGAQYESVGSRSRPSWPNKRLMQAQVAEAAFNDGWGDPVDSEELGSGLQTVHGYQLPGTNQYADDLLVLSDRNVVAVVVLRGRSAQTTGPKCPACGEMP